VSWTWGILPFAFPLSCARIQRCAESLELDESESYLILTKLNASVFAVFREKETPFAMGRTGATRGATGNLNRTLTN
jgi:hypothetical protein